MTIICFGSLLKNQLTFQIFGLTMMFNCKFKIKEEEKKKKGTIDQGKISSICDQPKKRTCVVQAF